MPPFGSRVNVEKAAVQDRGEAAIPIAECHGVFDQKLYGDTVLPGSDLGAPDCFFDKKCPIEAKLPFHLRSISSSKVLPS